MAELTRTQRRKKGWPLLRPQTKGGWWYEGPVGIDVFIEQEHGPVVAVRLYWRDILRAAQRSCKKEVIVRG